MITTTMKKALPPEEKGLDLLVGTIGLEPTTPTMSRRLMSSASPMNMRVSDGLCQTTMTASESKKPCTLSKLSDEMRAKWSSPITSAWLEEKREQLREEYSLGLDGVYEDE